MKFTNTKGGFQTGLSVCCLLAFGNALSADLTENDFPNGTGPLNQQNRWEAQTLDGGRWRGAGDAVTVDYDDTDELAIVWHAGHGERSQSRVLRSFPPTAGEKVEIRCQFIPGSDNIGGRFYFYQRDKIRVLALQFSHGRLFILEDGQKDATDTGVTFKPEQWNQITIQIDFALSSAKLWLNGEPIGDYEIAKQVTSVQNVILFAGGRNHSSSLKQFTVRSVSDFQAPR